MNEIHTVLCGSQPNIKQFLNGSLLGSSGVYQAFCRVSYILIFTSFGTKELTGDANIHYEWVKNIIT